ncbi:uncharacterized protein LOC119744739 [Patiria miniata]|uniref:Uncharacterized protein n=1 Tax=Patiria miniata TaxID=46514 RepID=A0A914BLW6_PATMI|nr:uncharacterized protein LOC119744739 [Patiria miniata]XP_038076756.1 uncharacterized protein LOC119744739 [Patiria miniata]
MASPLQLIWAAALLAAVMTSCVVRTAPTGVKEQESDAGKFQEAVLEEAGNTEDVDEAVGDALAKDAKIEKEETLLAEGEHGEALDGDEEEKEEVVEDAMDEVLNRGKDEVIEDLKEDVINDADSMETDDVIVTGSSSQPEASDYLWEPSFEYDLSEGDLDTWYLYNLPDEPSEWSSNFEIFDEEYFPYYGSSYEDVNGVYDDLDNNLLFDMPPGVFNGIPAEELNNKVDQTVDEFLCMLGLCDDVRVYPDDDVWEEPNEIQFTEEGMLGNSNEVEEESEEKDIYPVDVKSEEQKEEATNSSAKAEAADGQPPPVGSRHRSKRDLSWDQLERDNELLSKINSLEVDGAVEETAEDDTGLTAADRFEDLLEYFKDEAAENEKAADEEEFYLAVPEPILNEIVREATGGEFQDVIEDEEALEEEEDQANLADGIEETGGFIEDAEDVEGGDEWGAYLVPGSPYVQDTLKYDGYKRDDEREALKVYIESLQNLEGYRKRTDRGDDGSRSAADFLRQLVPRSPPNAIRYPKTGLEPFSREKYFPLFSDPDVMERDVEDDDEDILDTNQEDLLERYNELMELLNNELEATVLISTIQDMAAELGRDRQLLDELAEEEAEEELQLALDENNQEILELVGIANSHPMKRAPRIIDYPDFNEYPPEFHRSVPAFEGKANSLSEEEMLRLYEEYLNEAAEEAKWGDFIYQPRERREGEDSLTGPHGAYYVQGRMMGDLMKPKREWMSKRDDPALYITDDETDQPYILLDPSDLGYVEWPGDFEIFYDTRDGTYVLYPYPKPQDASVLSDEALLDDQGLSERNFVIDDGGDAVGEEREEWGDFKDDGVLLNDMKTIEDDLDQLEDLQILTEIAAKLGREDERAREEETLLRALLGK